MKTQIYFDSHATTRIDPRVREAMEPWFFDRFGNAGSSSHAAGWQAAKAVDRAREQLAELLGARPDEIVFTSGATEANNIAILGTALPVGMKGHLVTAVTEHPAVLDPIAWAVSQGMTSTVLPVDSHGRVEPAAVLEALREDTVLVSLMAANNEVGTRHDIATLGAALRERGIRFHCDAAQAVGRVPLDVEDLGADLLSLSAHKFHGPKGVGALLVRRDMKGPRLTPLHHGGGQEGGLRPGTTNVLGVVGLGEAAAVAARELPDEAARIAGRRDRLQHLLVEGVPGLRVNGHAEHRLPGNLSVTFPGRDAEELMLALPQLALSAGSACSSGSGKASHVLRALGLSDEDGRSTLRFGLSRFTTDEEVEEAARLVIEAAQA